MLVYEISKKPGSVKRALAIGAYNTWDGERIKLSFNFGRGTEKDFLRYMIDNMKYCYFLKQSDVDQITDLFRRV